MFRLNNSEEFFLYNPYAEDLILMGILSNKDIANFIFSEIDEKLFYLKPNKIIFQNMRNLYLEKKMITPIALIDLLDSQQILKNIGGKKIIHDLGRLHFPMSTIEANAYISILRDKYIKRSLLKLSLILNQLVYSSEEYNQYNFEELILEFTKTIQLKSISELVEIKNLFSPTLSYLRESRDSNDNNPHVKTGFDKIDFYLHSLEKGSLIIIAGRPSIGKTAFALSLIVNICQQKRKPCIIFFTLEMSKTQIISRLMSLDSNLTNMQLIDLKLHDSSELQLKNLFPSISQAHIYIEDKDSITLEEISEIIQKAKQKHKEVDLVIIDYLQLLGKKQDNRAQEIGYITRTLKNNARQFDVPVIALSQLNRNVEQRANKKPLLADLRESGCLSQQSLIFLNSAQLKLQNIENCINYPYLLLETLYLPKQIIKQTLLKQGYQPGNKHLYHIILKNNYNLRLTANHKILTLYGWKRIDSLNLYDHIAIFCKKIQTTQFIPILVICYSNKETIFDLQVPPFKNFIANNIIIHNSIEQDADIVLFLYREDYYSGLTPCNNSAEIIIAKNRNGMTGNILLQFVPEIAKFT
uniref:replication helicase subunit n=1 Tax=Stylonema alsidii TaxID=35155 RepID=UPI001FCD3BA2|nr:replication helicase subunit [Stylonema alsidii]UNJ15214.1 replication helicase subunit [Stylonema alsidii]